MEDDEAKKAVAEVDRIEDEEAAQRKKDKEKNAEKNEDEFYICPQCKAPLNEDDFKQDEVADMMATSVVAKIYCTHCGYVGLPVEVDKKEYMKAMKEQGKD